MLREPYPRALFCHNRTWHQRRYWSSIPVNTTQRTCHTKSLQHPKSFLLQTAIIAVLGHYWSTTPRTQGLYCVNDWTPEEGFRDSRQEEPSASHIRWRNEIKENAVHLRKVMFVIYRDVTVGFGAQEVHTVSPCHSQGTCSVHRPQRCHASFQSSCWMNKTKHPHVQPQGLPCPYRYSICGSCHQRTSDSQQGSLTEQPKHSHLVMSTNWEEEKSNFKEA